jgi:hypothetical protein
MKLLGGGGYVCGYGVCVGGGDELVALGLCTFEVRLCTPCVSGAILRAVI